MTGSWDLWPIQACVAPDGARRTTNSAGQNEVGKVGAHEPNHHVFRVEGMPQAAKRIDDDYPAPPRHTALHVRDLFSGHSLRIPPFTKRRND
ncbi:MAG: hypothetical protein H6Q33_136, partial [Deltaproteobacteria bacterium]|nr:hypothetical protein [Deltaproteobacteria bacterium]